MALEWSMVHSVKLSCLRHCVVDAFLGLFYSSASIPLACAEASADKILDSVDLSGTLAHPKPLENVDMVYLIDVIPRSVRTQPIYPSFIKGYSACYSAVSAVLRDGGIPTVQTVSQELTSLDYDTRYTNHYLQKGGKIEFVLNGVAYRSWEEVSETCPLTGIAVSPKLLYRDPLETVRSTKPSATTWKVFLDARTTTHTISFAST